MSMSSICAHHFSSVMSSPFYVCIGKTGFCALYIVCALYDMCTHVHTYDMSHYSMCALHSSD